MPARDDRPDDEPLWIAKIAAGDQQALGWLYDRYARSLYSLAYKSLGSVEECEELVVDVFAQVWRIADRYDVSRARVDTWLFMMARSRILDRLRRKQRQAKVTDAIALDPPTNEAPGPEPTSTGAAARPRTGLLPGPQPSRDRRAHWPSPRHRQNPDPPGIGKTPIGPQGLHLGFRINPIARPLNSPIKVPQNWGI
jgi:RNA polymerase sigma-70 factor, ECF subfamily